MKFKPSIFLLFFLNFSFQDVLQNNSCEKIRINDNLQFQKEIHSSIICGLGTTSLYATTYRGKQANVELTPSDISMAQQTIKNNTMTLPGFNPGTSYTTGPGPFCTSDALILYMLKFHQNTKTCPPIAVVAEALKQISDTEFNKKAAAIYWQEYTGYKSVNTDEPEFLSDYFELYIITKHTNKLKISNARLQGYIGAEEAWRKAMESQQKSWQKSADNQHEYILIRDAYRVILNTQAAIDAAAKAVSGGY